MKGANGKDASTAKHQAKLAEWRTLVAECRSSGKSVRAWCAEQNILGIVLVSIYSFHPFGGSKTQRAHFDCQITRSAHDLRGVGVKFPIRKIGDL